jgi:chromosome segregation ATPase
MNKLEIEISELRARLKCQVGALRQINSQLEAKIKDLTVSRDLFRYLNEQGIQTNEKVVQRFEEEHKLRIKAERDLKDTSMYRDQWRDRFNAVVLEKNELGKELQEARTFDSSRSDLQKLVTRLVKERSQIQAELDHSTEVINRYLKEIETLKTTNKVLHELKDESKLPAGSDLCMELKFKRVPWEYQVMSDKIAELQETIEHYRTKI